MEAFTQAEEETNGDGEGRGGEEEGAPPFRFEKVVSASPRSTSGAGSDRGRGKKKAKPSSAGRAMLDEALGRIDEPLALLVASCAAVSSLVEVSLFDFCVSLVQPALTPSCETDTHNRNY